MAIKNEDREWYAENATRIGKLILLNAPSVIIANDLATLVCRLRNTLGRELVDLKISECQKVFDARNQGVCEDCFDKPAIGGDSPNKYRCLDCEKKLEEEFRQMDIEDAMEKDPINDIKNPS